MLRTLAFRHCSLDTLLLPIQSTIMANLQLQPLDDSQKHEEKRAALMFSFSQMLLKQKQESYIRFFTSGSSLSFSLNCLKSSYKDVLIVSIVASELMLLHSFVFAFRLRLQFDDASGSATLVAAVAKLSFFFYHHT